MALDLAKVSTDVLVTEVNRRKELLTKQRGKYATLKVMRLCPGCKKQMHTRLFLTHPCTLSVRERKRLAGWKGWENYHGRKRASQG